MAGRIAGGHVGPSVVRAVTAAVLAVSVGWGVIAALPSSPVARASAAVLPPAPASWSVRTWSPAAEDLLAALTNQARASAGLPPLAVDARLTWLARWRSRDMAVRGYFSHEIPPAGSTVFDVMRSIGIDATWVGENIGWDSAAPADAASLVERAFLGSSAHLANILDARYDAFGVGTYRAANGREYFTVIFMDGTPDATLPALEASGRVSARMVAGTRITVWATISGGAYPDRVGWYFDGRRIGSGARISFTSASVGEHQVRLVVVDAAGTVARRTYALVVLPRPS